MGGMGFGANNIYAAGTGNNSGWSERPLIHHGAPPPTVTFDANGGTGTMAPQTSSGSAALTLNTFTRTGYTFAGWSTTPTGAVVYADGATYNFSADLTLYAQWTGNPEMNLSRSGTSYATGDYFDLGGRYIGQNACYGFDIQNTGTANLTLDTSTISGPNADQFNVQTQPVTPVAPSGSTYISVCFNPTSGWLKDCTLSIPNNDSNENPYVLNISGNSFATVTFDANGGTGTMAAQTSSVPANLTLNTFTLTGYTFAGWNTAADGLGTSYADGANYSFSADMTLHAQWAPLPLLYVEDKQQYMHGLTTFQVPVKLNPYSYNLSAAGFKLSYDATCLSFDSVTDSKMDGIPDSVTGLPGGFEVHVRHTGNAVETLVKPPNNVPPLPTLSAGALATFEFGVLPGCVTTDGSTRMVTFALSGGDFGDNQGAVAPGVTQDGKYTLYFAATPTEITLTPTPSSVAENLAAGASVGAFDSTDVDESLPPGDSHSYSLVAACAGHYGGNDAFQIDAGTLKTRARFDFESTNSYALCVRTTDQYGLFYEKAFTVAIVDVNEAPTAISLDDNHVAENLACGCAGGHAEYDRRGPARRHADAAGRASWRATPTRCWGPSPSPSPTPTSW